MKTADWGSEEQVSATCGLLTMVRRESHICEPDVDADWHLVVRCQAGDTAAFGELVERHKRAVYGVVSRIIGNREDVEDVVQDIFVNAYRAIRSFRGHAKFSTWLYSIAVNVTLKRLKKLRRQSTISIDDPAHDPDKLVKLEPRTSSDEVVIERQKMVAVKRAVDSLPEKQRIVVVMHYFEQLPCEEIARILNCSVGTVWSRLHYACKRLRSELDWLEQSW